MYFGSLTTKKKSPTKKKAFSRLICNKCFVFHPQGETEGIRSSDTYVMTDVRRNATGEYKCSLTDKSMMDATTITVHCKSLHFVFGSFCIRIENLACTSALLKEISLTDLR